MIVWGGTVYMQGSSNTGDRYDPQTDTWTPMSVTGAPAGRFGHTAVWTGSEMVIWGGESAPATNTGGRYDPAADTWMATTTANAPSARLDHTAVWTGDAMIVWGGRSEFAPSGSSGLATGGRYDPAADTWMATTTANAPSARLYHASVWSGEEMIVWGGEDAGIALGDGARYRPTTDAWSPVSAASAPDPRTGHTGVWTGTEMIVWGGEGTPSPLWPADEAMLTGGRYDPVTDAWRPTTTGGSTPGARSGHTATWGDGRMFVFGGVNPMTEPGAAYCAHASGTTGVGPPGPPVWRGFAAQPNPTWGSATLAFDLDRAADVTVRVFDLAGREVARPLAGERIPPGRTVRLWQPDELPAGLYFLRAVVDGREIVRRLVLLRRP
jgi:N-acetylneuraminic acid mutarotase